MECKIVILQNNVQKAVSLISEGEYIVLKSIDNTLKVKLIDLKKVIDFFSK